MSMNLLNRNLISLMLLLHGWLLHSVVSFSLLKLPILRSNWLHSEKSDFRTMSNAYRARSAGGKLMQLDSLIVRPATSLHWCDTFSIIRYICVGGIDWTSANYLSYVALSWKCFSFFLCLCFLSFRLKCMNFIDFPRFPLKFSSLHSVEWIKGRKDGCDGKLYFKTNWELSSATCESLACLFN